MKIKEAAINVLREARQPLTAQEIADRILSAGLWTTAGPTLAATVAALLYSDTKTSDEKSPFVLVGSQTFGLREIGAKPVAPKFGSRRTSKGSASAQSLSSRFDPATRAESSSGRHRCHA